MTRDDLSVVSRALTGTRERPQLTFRRTYRASPAEVRDACANVDRLSRWFGTVNGEPSQVGDRFTVVLGDEHDVAEGRVLRCGDDEIAVAWSWQGEPESVITARIAPADEGTTTLELQHTLEQPAAPAATPAPAIAHATIVFFRSPTRRPYRGVGPLDPLPGSARRGRRSARWDPSGKSYWPRFSPISWYDPVSSTAPVASSTNSTITSMSSGATPLNCW